MKRWLQSRILVAVLFGLIGAVATLAATGNLPGLSDDPEVEPRRARSARTTDASEPGTAFTTHPDSSPPGAARASSRARRYSYEDDYRDQLYEQYFGYEEEEDEGESDYQLIQPDEDGGGSGQPGEPGEPGIPDDDDDSDDGSGGPGGPGGEGGG